MDMPSKSEFVIIPVCELCNREKAANDSYVRDVLVAATASEENPKVLALLPAVMRSDQKNWSDLTRDIRRHLRWEAQHSSDGIYLGDYPCVPLTWERLKRFFILVVRGLYWHATNERLPDDYVFDVRSLDKVDAAGILRDWIAGDAQCLCSIEIGKDVFIAAFIIGADDRFNTVWLMQFYGSISILVASGPKSFFDQLDPPKGTRRFFGPQ
jgi:hypothetical protein